MTYEITKEQAGEPICEGYKAIKWDSSTKGSTDFRYGAEGENLVGKIFTVDGEISPCGNGLHFSKNPAHVFEHYEPLGYNRYFRVRAYGKTVDADEGHKTVAQTIEFLAEYYFMEFMELVGGNNRSSSNNFSNGNNCSDGNSWSSGNNCSNGNNCSDGNNWSNGNDYSDGNNYSNGNSHSDGNSWSSGNNFSNGNSRSDGNNWSSGNNCSYGNSHSHGTSCCFALKNCKGAYNSAFCIGKNGIANCLFNEQSTEKRCYEVVSSLKRFGWFPKWHNVLELKGNKEWWAICFPKLKENSVSEAWADMPKEMLEYIKSLPEYDEEIFKEITGQ